MQSTYRQRCMPLTHHCSVHEHVRNESCTTITTCTHCSFLCKAGPKGFRRTLDRQLDVIDGIKYHHLFVPWLHRTGDTGGGWSRFGQRQTGFKLNNGNRNNLRNRAFRQLALMLQPCGNESEAGRGIHLHLPQVALPNESAKCGHFALKIKMSLSAPTLNHDHFTLLTIFHVCMLNIATSSPSVYSSI